MEFLRLRRAGNRSYDAMGNRIHPTYDTLDRVIQITGSEGETKTYTYDSIGNVLSMTDGLGAVTQYAYSLTGKLTKVTDPLGNETAYTYDDRNQLVEICQYGAFAETEIETKQTNIEQRGYL